MTDSGLYLLDVAIRACPNVNDVIKRSSKGLADGVKKSEDGKLLHMYKIVGENRFIAVLNSGVEAGLSAMNDACGGQVDVKCLPFRTYEGLAERVMQVDKSLTEVHHDLPSDGHLYWICFQFTYQGMSLEELLQAWNREAVFAMTSRKSGALTFDMYKTLGACEAHTFTKSPADEEAMDDLTFGLPFVKELGTQLKMTIKALIPLV